MDLSNILAKTKQISSDLVSKLKKEKISESKPVYSENDRKALDLIVALARLQKKIDDKNGVVLSNNGSI